MDTYSLLISHAPGVINPLVERRQLHAIGDVCPKEDVEVDEGGEVEALGTVGEVLADGWLHLHCI